MTMIEWYWRVKQKKCDDNFLLFCRCLCFFFVLKIFKFNHLCFVCCVCICFVHLHHFLMRMKIKCQTLNILSFSLSLVFYFISFHFDRWCLHQTHRHSKNELIHSDSQNSKDIKLGFKWTIFSFLFRFLVFYFQMFFFEMKIETKRLHYTNIWYVTDYWLIDWLIDWSYFLFWLTFVLGLFRFFWIYSPSSKFVKISRLMVAVVVVV